MNKGDWVTYVCDGRIGQITVTEYLDKTTRGYHLVDFGDKTFARMVHQQYLKPVAPPVADILNAVQTNEEK